MKWHPDSRDKANTSLWEPTRQTEEYWRRQIRQEVSDWEERHEDERSELVLDPDCPEWEGEMRAVIPRVIEDGTSETFTAPNGEGEWLNAHSSDPSELPAVVVSSLEDNPYDNDVSDGNEDTWAAEIVKERAVRIHTCFGLVCYLQPPLEWAKTTYRIVFHRNQLEENDGKWFPAGPRTSYPEGYNDKERYKAHRLLYPLTGPAHINTGVIRSWADDADPDKYTPRPAGWRPHVPSFWGTRFPGDDADVSHYNYWTRAGKTQSHIQIPGPYKPTVMPWNNPDPEKVAEWAGWFDGEQPTFLSPYLNRLRFMNDYIVTDPYDEDKPLFGMVDDKGEKMEFDRNTRRLRLTASCGYRHAKSWECPDHRIMQELVIQEEATWSRDEDRNYFCEIEEQDADYQFDVWTAGEEEVPIRGVPFERAHWQSHRNYGVTFRPKINLRWEIRRRDRRWDFRPEKVPGYKLHCSAQSIMAITGCSRATAFRWIEKFMADQPEPEPWTPAVCPAPDPGSNRGVVTLPGQTFHWSGLLGTTRMARYGQSTIPARWGNMRRKIVLHIQLHSLSRTHPNCPK